MKNPLVERGFFVLTEKLFDSAQTDIVKKMVFIIRVVTLSGVEAFMLLFPNNLLRHHIAGISPNHYFKFASFPIIIQSVIVEFQIFRC